MTTLPSRSRRQRRGVKTWAATLVTTALIASTLIATAAQVPSADAAGTNDGAVSGTVFRNVTSTGWKSPGTVAEPAALPVAGVTATAYDAQGDVVGSAVSGSNGDYSIGVADAFSDALRVEFSGWPTELQPGYAAQGTAPSPLPAANDTSVQFVTLGAGNTASGVDFGLVKPDQITQPNAPIATTVQSAGARALTSGPLPAIVAQPWGLDGPGLSTTAAVSKLARFEQTGSIWGMAYAQKSNDLFVSAMLKRMSAVGPLGIGGIYRTQDALLPNGSVNASATTADWFSFAGLPVSNAGNVPLDLGLAPTDRGLRRADQPAADIEAFSKSGRVGIGAIVTSPDSSRLFASNLHDGDVYAVDIANPDIAPSSAYRIPTPVGESQAIWAVQVHDGRLYIGYVDTGNAANGTPDPGKSARSKEMKAYVASTPIDGVLDPAAPAPAWATELTIDLGYTKGSNIHNWTAENGVKFDVQFPQMTRWNSWTNTWNWAGGSVAKRGENRGVDLHQYPQAILGSIAFDVDGYLNLGFVDRTAIQSGNRSFPALPNDTSLWTTISNGDVVVAAPRSVSTAAAGCPALNESENYVLECGGKVGDRPVRTSATGGQEPSYDNSQGPVGGEFFNDRRNLGIELPGIENHNEIGLGAVTSYPGSRELATTAMDPLADAYNTGLMWFDQRNGTATRGIDLVPGGGGGAGRPSFQKSGGLGAAALLAVAAPVEIGNRVWLDADLNGRQDADEPAINGAVVELWTADAGGQPVDKIATRTTATIDGQPGTYYFRSDDSDVIAANNAHPFVPNASYVLVFQTGSTLALAGPNANHAGFAGLQWSDLQRTSAEVRSDGTSETNDSNPDVVSGRALITVGDRGHNNHTYDAGWYATNSYELSKAFSPSNVVIPSGNSYTFDVLAARNFRGEDRLASGGTGTPSDPQVTEAELTLSSPSWKHSSNALPLGYTLLVGERGASTGSVAWSTPVSANPDRGQVTIIPKRGAQTVAQLTATNRLGSFEVIKTVTGTAASAVPASVKFTLEYSLDGGATVQTGSMSKATSFKLDALPLETTVRFREPTPIVTDPVMEGITWGAPVWTQVPGLTGPDAGGWYSYTVTVAKPTISLSLRNTADTILGGFSILKELDDDTSVATGQKFSFQYKVGAEGTPITLGPIDAGSSVSTPKTIVYGSTVLVREIAPPDLGHATWETPAWSGLPADAVGPDANGWYSFVFKPSTSAPLELTVVNTAIPQYGTFTVEKTVQGSGVPDAAGESFTFWYRTAPPVGGGPAVFGPEQSFELQDGATWQGPTGLLVGTLVQLREQQPANRPDLVWKTPSWTLDGSAVAVVGGRIQFPITAGTEGAAQAVVTTNEASKLFGLTLQKSFLGSGVDEVVGLDFDVDVKISGRSDELVTLNGDGTAWQGPTDLVEGTVVMVKERSLPDVNGIAWGAPIWTDGTGSVLGPDNDGWSTFTIGDASTSAALTLTNTPSVLGQFQVKKKLVTSGDPTLPANYTIKYTVGNDAEQTLTLTAGETSAVVGDLPIGTVVTLQEVAPPALPDVEWAPPVWTTNGAPSAIENGWVTFEITDGALVEFEVTNAPNERFGEFRVSKGMSGTAAGMVPAGTKFWFSYTLDGGAPQSISATPDTPSALVGSLPHGTVVTIEEVTFPEIPGVTFGANPGWTINGVAVDADKITPVTFTIDLAETQTVELGVNNTAEPEYGQFELTKAITGDGADRVPDDASFEVEYSLDDGDTWESMDAITKQSLTVSSPDILVGSNVQVREVAPADGVAFRWGTPEFTVNGTNQGSSAQFTITLAGVAAEVLELNNPALPKDATFTVEKRLTGDFDVSDPELSGRSFTAEWSVSEELHGTIVLNAANNWKAGPAEGPFPTGTVVTLTEGAVTGLPSTVQNNGYAWLDGVPGVTVSGDGRTATLVVGSGTPTPLVLTNDLTKLGTFEVEKLIDGDFDRADPEFAELEFTVNWSGGGRNGSFALNAENEWTGAPGGALFPKGTEITLTEAEVTGLPPHVSFTDHVWLASVPGVTVSADGHTATLIVAGGAPAQLTVKNSFELKDGTFTVKKTVVGPFALTDPEFADIEFTANWSGGSRSGSIALNAENEWTGAPAGATFPVGTTITLTEGTVPGLPAHVQFTGYSWLDGVPGVTLSDDGATATLIVQDGDPAELTLENRFEELDGSFVVQKQIEGGFTLDDPEFADVEFTVNWSGGGRTGAIDLNAGNGWKNGPGGDRFPKGTEITLTEGDAPELPEHVGFTGYRWLEGVEGVTVSDDGRTATLTVVEDAVEDTDEGEVRAPVELTLLNVMPPLSGSFEVEKLIDGDFDRTDPEFAGIEFTANWAGGGRSGALALNAENEWTGTPDGPAFPTGTVIELTEAAVTGLPPHVEFDRYSWVSGVPGVTVSADGRTATLVVGDGESTQLTLKNSFSIKEGTFQLEKIVDGDFTLGDEELKDLTFLAQYSASNGTSGSLALNAAGEWMAEAGRMFPTGTTITLTEAAVTQNSLPPHVSWDGYEWLPSDDYTVSADGLTASFIVGDGTDVALTMRNSFQKLNGAFAVQKTFAGDYRPTDPELSGLNFVAAYTASNGTRGTLDLNAQNGWSAAAGVLPVGTTVTVTEVTPSGLPAGIGWDGYRWMPTAGVDISGDGQTAVLDIENGVEPTIRLTLENSFTALKNTFSVEKVVAGDFALDSPELAGLTFRAPYTASNGVEGTLELNQAGSWAATPGQEFPVGTVITVTEAEVTGLPEHVRWDGYAWLAGEGHTVSPDGKTASFTLEAESVRPELKLALQNSFSAQLGGFTLTKQVTGDAAERVPDDMEFTAEFSLDGGGSWAALPAMTKGAVVSGPSDIALGTTVLIRELAPAAVPGVAWGTPAFSGTGVQPGTAGEPSSFVIGSSENPVQVLLSNPTTPSNGQFQVTKKITGAGASLLKGDPIFTVKYSYQGQQGAGEFTIKAGEFASSESIPSGTVVTITELAVRGGLVDGASWGTAVFVLADGRVLENGSAITIGADTLIELQLENPTRPPLPSTGFDGVAASGVLALLLGAAGLLFLLIGRRRRKPGPMRGRAAA